MTKEEYPLHKLTNGAISEYLDLVKNTETPPIFHTWSLISAASACLGRRCWFQMGAIRIMPNQYVMLVGAPAVKKSTSVSFMRKIVNDITGLRFAPNNTAGRMQGLLARMIGETTKKTEDDDVEDALANLSMNLVEGMDYSDMDEDTNILDKHALYVMEGELATFIGVKSTDFITFLTDMWDKSGEAAYEYQLKKEIMRVQNPCLNLIGAITPMHITTYLPPEAIGQGFMSRMIMVYAEEGKKVAWPEPLDEKRKNGFKALLTNIFTQFEGAFTYTEEAKQEIIDLHGRGYGHIEDARFIHYMQRRQTHTIKAAMALAALRLSKEVSKDDIIDAHMLLEMTEARMAESLGEYGLSPVALARARIVDILKTSAEPLTAPRIGMAVGGDIRHSDVKQAIYELTEQGQIVELIVYDAHGNTRNAYITHKTLIKRDAKDRVKVSYPVRDTAAKIKEIEHAQHQLEQEVAPAREMQGIEKKIEELADEYEKEYETSAPTLAKSGVGVLDRLKQFTGEKND